MTTRQTLVSAACALIAGCESQPQPAIRDAASGQSPQRRGKAFVVFAVPDFVIDRTAVPILPPMTPGSELSPTTAFSEAPDIVSVDPSGALVGRRNGRALVRAVDTGSVLRVLVAAVESIRIVPDRVRLEPRAQTRLRLIASDGTEIPAGAATWATSSSEVATVWKGLVHAGRAERTAVLTATYGDRSTTVEIEVVAASVPVFAVRPARARFRVGSMLSFDALSQAGPIDALWSTSNPRVATRMAGALFRGESPGTASVCATAGARRACTNVEVVP